MKTKQLKTKTNKQTPRKQKTKQSKTKQPKTKQTINNNLENKPKSNKVVVYSKNPKTGYETVMEAEKMEKDGMKSLMVKSESVLPPTIITQNGPNYTSTSMLTMAQKRQMVVQSFRA
jgi:hypothetical protein